MRPETRVVYVESPASQTFEVEDLPAIAAAAHERGALVLFDNTWATPLFFRPLAHGADVSAALQRAPQPQRHEYYPASRILANPASRSAMRSSVSSRPMWRRSTGPSWGQSVMGPLNAHELKEKEKRRCAS